MPFFCLAKENKKIQEKVAPQELPKESNARIIGKIKKQNEAQNLTLCRAVESLSKSYQLPNATAMVRLNMALINNIFLCL